MNRWELTIGSGEHYAFDILEATVLYPSWGYQRFYLQCKLKIHRVSILADDNEVEFGEISVLAWLMHACVGYADFDAAGSQNFNKSMEFEEMIPGGPISFEVQQHSFSGIPISSIKVRLEGELDGTLTPIEHFVCSSVLTPL